MDLTDVKSVVATPNGIRIGDCVVVQYLDDNKTTTFTLRTTHDDITNGYLAASSALGRELLGLAEDEIDFEAGGRVRRIMIVRTQRPAAIH